MLARKIKPGQLEILDIDLKKELESYTLIEISEKDAYLLLLTTNGFKVGDNNTAIINYQSEDATDKMFKAIVHKRQETSDKPLQNVSRKYEHTRDVIIPGTSVLIRDVSTQTITIARRTTSGDFTGTINRLFILDTERDAFFTDARKSAMYKKTHKYVIDTQDKELYEKWCDFMNDKYFRILKFIDDSKMNASKLTTTNVTTMGVK